MDIVQNDIDNNKRKLKSLTERILLIDETLILDNQDQIYGIDFKILGSKNLVYILHVWRDHCSVKCECNCMDHKMRNRDCKHMYWLGSRKFGNIEPSYWNIMEYKKVVTDCWIELQKYDTYVGRNEICPICLDDIDYDSDVTICCKYQCKNSVHSICWSRLYSISKKTNCVVCRTNVMPM
jgi:hypothetical protein